MPRLSLTNPGLGSVVQSKASGHKCQNNASLNSLDSQRQSGLESLQEGMNTRAWHWASPSPRGLQDDQLVGFLMLRVRLREQMGIDDSLWDYSLGPLGSIELGPSSATVMAYPNVLCHSFVALPLSVV